MLVFSDGNDEGGCDADSDASRASVRLYIIIPNTAYYTALLIPTLRLTGSENPPSNSLTSFTRKVPLKRPNQKDESKLLY